MSLSWGEFLEHCSWGRWEGLVVLVLSILGDAESEDYFVVKNGVGVGQEEYIVERETGCNMN